MSEDLDTSFIGNAVPTNKPFWMREYWDRYIRNKQHLNNVIEYIHQNPVKANLCKAPEDWLYSIASRVELGNAKLQLGTDVSAGKGDSK